MNDKHKKFASSEDAPDLHAPPPSVFEQVKQIFESICANLKKESDPSNERDRSDFIADFQAGFASGTWSWRPIIEEVADDKVDRLGEVIMGPLYTCQEYPWPEASGFPMAPLIQLDLRRASEIGGLHLGDGLLQVWMPHEAVSTPLFIRVVPRDSVDVSKLTLAIEIPTNMSPLQKRDEVWSDELEEFVPRQSFQITGYEAGRFTCQIAHQIQDNYQADVLSVNSVTQTLIKDFDKKLKPLLKKGAKGFHPGDCHLFGTFVRLQYSAMEVPKPLFCFESDDLGFMWGDSGNAQLFYEISNDGKVSFSFDWAN